MITKCFEKLRFHVFWLIDFLKGSKVKKHYSDITYILENYSSLRAVSKRKAYLNNILNHASATTPFYANKKIMFAKSRK